MSSQIHHPYRIDDATASRMGARLNERFSETSQSPGSLRYLATDPAVFSHAYLLMGANPQRFLSDLTLYLSGVKAFFERSDTSGGIRIANGGNPDSHRRLSEDLGVGCASLFIVEAFDIPWISICQIPANLKLSKTRPDFQAFSKAGLSYIFEAKGTTKLKSIEAAMSKALGQVKHYPASAQAKLAIVTYLSVDERFFPSSSFVVDPPAGRGPIEMDDTLCRELHFEKALQFAGLDTTARTYVEALAYRVRQQQRDRFEPREAGYLRPPDARDFGLRNVLRGEQESRHLDVRTYEDGEYLGRAINDTSGLKLFLGLRLDALHSGLGFEPIETPTALSVSNRRVVSTLGDGTLLEMSLQGAATGSAL